MSMTADQVSQFIEMLDRIIMNRIAQAAKEGNEWHDHEVNEMKENMAAALLGVSVNELPESLQYTSP
jgi:hypothetical protein